ncbi:hypothetical protein GCM10023187_05860 [Nibrella viscosa]|uniref:Uncharacterized protein n=1 Tax=Nibrella viscosa TaxID=1084524 RepID=A0ABP8JX80_9BACT
MVIVYVAQRHNVDIGQGSKPSHVVVTHTADTNVGNAQTIAGGYLPDQAGKQGQTEGAGAAFVEKISSG